ncbi:MAG TPA: nucleoside triphosphate pyrophosphohydrolase [Candidatus Saccharimonadales bacterium]|jgi:predicted house-cleaning noncanonical NTP pyrophosphatase (MazG superfamily)
MSFEHTFTDLPAENEYPKLVRDKIPDIILAHDGVTVPTRILSDDDEYLAFLLRKGREEAEELSEAQTESNMREEIADLYEIIDTILALKGIPRADIVGIQDEKRQKRGGFDQRILMLDKR